MSNSTSNEIVTRLSREELKRYARHVSLPNVGIEGQRRLKRARVLIVGVGGLGSPVALYLAAAGVGTIGLVDHDVVDASNLHRQLLHGTSDVGRPKLQSARESLAELNPHVDIELHEMRLASENALDVIARYDLVIDGTDNFATRYLVNDACVLLGKPNVYGSIFQFEGQVSVFATRDGPCYRCLMPEPPLPGTVPSCAEGGVLGVLPGLIGTMQATEAIKLILGEGETLAGRLLLVDALRMEFRSVKIDRDPACPACGTRTITSLLDYDEFCGTMETEKTMAYENGADITPAELAARLRAGDSIDVIDVREPHEWDAGHIEQARLIPMGTFGDVIDTLDRDKEIVLVCRSGNRSGKVMNFLFMEGFTNVHNMVGGMVRWAEEVGEE